MMETDIKQYIEEKISELRDRLFPVLTTDISKLSAVYLFTDISSDHVKESQLTLNVIGADYGECMEVHQKLKGILAMKSDQAFVKYQDTYFYSELSSGGGALFNDDLQMWEISKYYILNWR